MVIQLSLELGATPIRCACSAHTNLFFRACSGIPLGNLQMRTIKHLPDSLQASRNFYKKSTQVQHATKLKHSARVMNQSGRSTRHAIAQLQSARGLLWRTSTRGTHVAAQDDHPDRGGSGRLLLKGYIRNACCARHQEASSQIGKESSLP